MPYPAPPRSVEGVISLNGSGRGMIGFETYHRAETRPAHTLIPPLRHYSTTALDSSLPALVRLLPRSSGIIGSHMADLFY
jgi:hypothetical protein